MEKTARLLVLFCFFHYSGLNNGLAWCVVVSSGKMEACNVTPGLVRSCGQILNPSNWKPFLVSFGRHHLLKHKRAVEISSQAVIHQIVVGTSALRVRVRSSLDQISPVVRTACGSKRPSGSLVQKSGSPKEPELSVFLNHDEKYDILGDSPECVVNDRDEVWMRAKRAFLCSSRQQDLIPKLSLWNGHLPRNKDPSADVCPDKGFLKQGCIVFECRWRHRQLFFSPGGNSGEDAPANLLRTSVDEVAA